MPYKQNLKKVQTYPPPKFYNISTPENEMQ